MLPSSADSRIFAERHRLMSIPPTPPTRPAFGRLLDLIATAGMAITGVALVVLTAIFGWLVFGRYVLNSTPTWVEQVALLLVMLIGFVGAAVGIHRGSHLSIAYFRDNSPGPVRRGFVLLSHLALAGFGALMAVKGYELVIFKWGSDIPLISVPEGLRAIPLMLSGALILLFSLGHLLRWFKDPDDAPDG